MAISTARPSEPIVAAWKLIQPFSARKSTGGRTVSSRPTPPTTVRNSSHTSRALFVFSGMLPKPELAPVAAGLQGNEGVKRTRKESQHHHGDRPRHGDGQRLFAVDDPHREER